LIVQMKDLQQRWFKLNEDNNEQVLEKLWINIIQKYSEPHRFYHNLQHLEALFHWFDVYTQELIHPNAVAYAIFYHDFIYSPDKNDNEEQSALVAVEALQQLKLSMDFIQRVEFYIRSTKAHHFYKGSDNDLNYFLDFDLSILAAEREVYKLYFQNIRKEFAHVPDEQFRWGRGSYVKNWLRLPHLFFTGSFREKERQARENLRWELEEGLRHI